MGTVCLYTYTRPHAYSTCEYVGVEGFQIEGGYTIVNTK